MVAGGKVATASGYTLPRFARREPPMNPQRILIAGLCPLPFENTSQNYGPGIRTWQLTRGLTAAGHTVRVVAMEIPGVYEPGERIDEETVDGVSIRRLDAEAFLDPGTIAREVESFRPTALVGATIYGSLALAQTDPELPFWADQFGHVMAEAQAKAALEEENWPIPRWWRMVHPVMSRADRVSAVSERQRYAAIGELGALGRLTAETCGYEFTAVIPCGVVEPEEPVAGRAVARGVCVPEDAFIVLWSGGYNVWSDVETLFDGLELAMKEEPSVHFVSTGGAIGGHDDSTYARFQERIAGSPLQDRFQLAGWVKREWVGNYVEEADLGVLTDRPMYEGVLGSKNRILQWLAAGLPCAYNRVGDVGDLLADEDVGLIFEQGDAQDLARRMVWAARHRDELSAMARRGREVCQRRFSLAPATAPLVEWAAAPSQAPDHRPGALRSPFDWDEVPPEPPPPDPIARPSRLRRLARRVKRGLLGR